jgi:hypothetical protein
MSLRLHEERERERETGLPKYENMFHELKILSDLQKIPVNIRQKTLHTAYMAQAINNKNIL